MTPARPEQGSHSSDPPIAERKRRITRRILAESALALAVERGFENVTVPDIGAAAGVSARTFNNYFSSKEEAVVALGFDQAVRVVEIFEQRPVSESVWEAISSAILSQFPDDAETDTAAIEIARMVRDGRTLRGEQLKAGAAIEELLAAAIANRVDPAFSHGVIPHVIAGSAVAATRVAFDHWVDMDARLSLHAVVADALTLCGQGFAAIGMRAQQ